MKKKVIKLVTNSNNVKLNGLVVIAPIFRDTYITGQTRIPGVKGTEKFLSNEQALGKQPLTEEQIELFPYVIDPIAYMKFHNGHTFDPDDVKDMAILNYIKFAHPKEFALSKELYNKRTHSFYISDSEREAVKANNKFDLQYKAMTFIKESTDAKCSDIAMYLTYTQGAFFANPQHKSSDEIKVALLEHATVDPQAVLECFMDEREHEMIVTKLLGLEKIVQKSEGFFEGNTFLGETIPSVVEYMRKKENQATLSRWMTFVKNPVKEVIVEKQDFIVDELLSNFEQSLLDGDKEDAVAANKMLDKYESRMNREQSQQFIGYKTRLLEMFEKNEEDPKEELMSKTVPELKELLKEHPQGEWKELTKKKPIVDYLISKR